MTELTLMVTFTNGIVIVGVKMNDENILKAGLQIYSINDLIIHCVTMMQQQMKILHLL